MSQVMKDLKQSERSYQQQIPAPYSYTPAYFTKQQAPKKRWMALLVFVPIVVVVLMLKGKSANVTTQEISLQSAPVLSPIKINPQAHKDSRLSLFSVSAPADGHGLSYQGELASLPESSFSGKSLTNETGADGPLLSLPALQTVPGDAVSGSDERLSALPEPERLKPLTSAENAQWPGSSYANELYKNARLASGLPINQGNSNSQYSGGEVIKTNQINVSSMTDADAHSNRYSTSKSTNKSTNNDSWDVGNLDLSGLSPELANKFRVALKENPSSSSVTSTKKKTTNRQSSSKSAQYEEQAISLMSNSNQFKGKLPKLDFQMHLYSTNSRKRWVKVNGKNVREGEWIVAGNTKLERILKNDVIVRFNGQYIRIPALYGWTG